MYLGRMGFMDNSDIDASRKEEGGNLSSTSFPKAASKLSFPLSAAVAG
jgi:hypothetical protein